MRNIIYYVATSLDGYIAGPNEDISKFAAAGEGVQQYLADLQAFKTVIMGRKTYEFGYKYGLEAGQPAYPHMDHYIFSTSLKFEKQHSKVHIVKPEIALINDLKSKATTDIYLCGGGAFAGWLLENQMIDILKLKVNPIVMGGGTRIFGDNKASAITKLIATQSFNNGLEIKTYQVNT